MTPAFYIRGLPMTYLDDVIKSAFLQVDKERKQEREQEKEKAAQWKQHVEKCFENCTKWAKPIIDALELLSIATAKGGGRIFTYNFSRNERSLVIGTNVISTNLGGGRTSRRINVEIGFNGIATLEVPNTEGESSYLRYDVNPIENINERVVTENVAEMLRIIALHAARNGYKI